VVNLLQTRSSAVAKGPRAASCLSVVRFNSTKRRLKRNLLLYSGVSFTAA